MSKLPTCTTNNDGSKEWRVAGKLHRVDGPAMILKSGTSYWYRNDKLHRKDGPAVEFPNGIKFWWFRGIKHRVDGPAVEFPDGTVRWYIDHVEFTNLNEFCDAAKITGEEKTIFLTKWAK